MDETFNKNLRRKVEEDLEKAIATTKLVKDETFCKSADEKLMLLKELMQKSEKLKTCTLEACKMVVETALRKTYAKLVLENDTNGCASTIAGLNSLENHFRSESTGNVTSSNNCISRTATSERLALKYPRRKISASENCSPFNVSHGSAEQSTSTLFKRRHEMFASPPQPATYGEHRRMMQLHEAAIEQSKSKAVLGVQITKLNNNKPSEISKQFADTDQMSVQSISMEPAASNNPPKLRNNNDIVGKQSQTNNNKEVRVLPETSNKTTNHESGSNCSTNDGVLKENINDQITENVGNSKPVKPKYKNINHRELHDLLSYTTEILPKLSRRKSVSLEDNNMQLLKQFGITKELQIVLERTDCITHGQIAQRTRSKSIDSVKYLQNLEAAKPTATANTISEREESKTAALKKQTTTATNAKTVECRGSKSIDVYKATNAINATNAVVKKSTARKSVSKPRIPVKPKGSTGQFNGIKTFTNNFKNDEEQTMAESSNVVSKRRTQHCSSPPLAKRTRPSLNDSNGESEVRTFGDDSDEDEPITQLPDVVLNRNPHPNNNPKVHCHSDYMEKCCLCSYNGELMVRHYVYNHPKKAVYVSRVAPEQAQLIRADPFGISGRKAVSRYGDQEIIVFLCHFCDLQLSESPELWLDHISKHTGEYRYKCSLCPTYARLPIDRVTHHSVCTNPSMQLWHTYNFDDNHLYAYMCNKCNFVQVLIVNMKRHLREDHPEASSTEIGYTKFSLVNFNLHDDDADPPYGRVKLEPILDDTNIGTQVIVKQEEKFTRAKDCQTYSTESAQDTIQPILQPEAIKLEIITDDLDLSETNASDIIAKKMPPQMVIFSADELKERNQHSYPGSVRVKRFPGDILSTTENNNPDKASRKYNPVDHSSSSIGHNDRFKRYPSSTGFTDTTSSTRACVPNNQQAPASSMVVLQPWIRKGVNRKMLHKSKLTVAFLTAPYKCTALNCGFYTDTAQIIGSHFQSHRKPTTLQPEACDNSWLECCYCDYASLSVYSLLEHIKTVHESSAFQCDRCCYRSRDSNSVRVHQLSYHSENDAESKLLCISRVEKPYSTIDRDIILNEMKSNVRSLMCKVAKCDSQKFCDLENYRNHMQKHGNSKVACHVCEQEVSANKMICHIGLHNMFMLQCVYCDFGSIDSQTMKKHIADNHSDKWLCYHVRCSKPNTTTLVRAQNRISPERFVYC